MRNKLKEKDRTEKLFIVENEVFCDIVTATPFCHKSDMLNCQCLI